MTRRMIVPALAMVLGLAACGTPPRHSLPPGGAGITAAPPPVTPASPTKQLIRADGSRVSCTGYSGPICVQP